MGLSSLEQRKALPCAHDCKPVSTVAKYDVAFRLPTFGMHVAFLRSCVAGGCVRSSSGAPCARYWHMAQLSLATASLRSELTLQAYGMLRLLLLDVALLLYWKDGG